jgi:hypothetical protein
LPRPPPPPDRPGTGLTSPGSHPPGRGPRGRAASESCTPARLRRTPPCKPAWQCQGAGSAPGYGPACQCLARLNQCHTVTVGRPGGPPAAGRGSLQCQPASARARPASVPHCLNGRPAARSRPEPGLGHADSEPESRWARETAGGGEEPDSENQRDCHGTRVAFALRGRVRYCF